MILSPSLKACGCAHRTPLRRKHSLTKRAAAREIGKAATDVGMTRTKSTAITSAPDPMDIASRVRPQVLLKLTETTIPRGGRRNQSTAKAIMLLPCLKSSGLFPPAPTTCTACHQQRRTPPRCALSNRSRTFLKLASELTPWLTLSGVLPTK